MEFFTEMFASLLKRGLLLKESICPLEANSFPLQYITFEKGLSVQAGKHVVTKLSLLYKMAKNLMNVFNPLNATDFTGSMLAETKKLYRLNEHWNFVMLKMLALITVSIILTYIGQ